MAQQQLAPLQLAQPQVQPPPQAPGTQRYPLAPSSLLRRALQAQQQGLAPGASLCCCSLLASSTAAPSGEDDTSML